MLESLTSFSFSTAQCWRNLNSHWLLSVLGRNHIFMQAPSQVSNVINTLGWSINPLFWPPWHFRAFYSHFFLPTGKNVFSLCLSPCVSHFLIVVVIFHLLYGLRRQSFAGDTGILLCTAFVLILRGFLLQVC